MPDAGNPLRSARERAGPHRGVRRDGETRYAPRRRRGSCGHDHDPSGGRRTPEPGGLLGSTHAGPAPAGDENGDRRTIAGLARAYARARTMAAISPSSSTMGLVFMLPPRLPATTRARSLSRTP